MDFHAYIIALAELIGLLVVLTPFVIGIVKGVLRAKYQARMEYIGKVLLAIGAAA